MSKYLHCNIDPGGWLKVQTIQGEKIRQNSGGEPVREGIFGESVEGWLGWGGEGAANFTLQ